MRQIGFKNFRKFEDFPVMDLAPITIFVGGNNAGKSTVVKAILSVLDYLNTQYFHLEREDTDNAILSQRFYFNKNYFAHIGTIKRALCNHSKSGVISFSITLDDYRFEIFIIDDSTDDEAISGKISLIKVHVIPQNIEIEFDFEEDEINACFHSSPSSLFLSNKGGRHFPSFLRRSEKELNKYFDNIQEDFEVKTTITGRAGMIGGPFLECLLSRFGERLEFLLRSDKENESIIKRRGIEKTPAITVSETGLASLKKNKDFFSHFGFMSWHYSIMMQDVEYIYAHAVTQTVIYSAKDVNDYLVKTIHEFANLKIESGSKIHGFIVKWMKEFNIGADYSIESVGGEAHIVKIYSKDGTSVNLADKGMGSIQLMILLFRLATKMPTERMALRGNNVASTIIVEEPEQNLHPMLQSKLADMFLELNKKYGFRFIIETHSEYLIRKTQVIVKNIFNDEKKPLSENPFKIYYFDSESKKKPYFEMIYQNDGNFSNDFGKGFFDEASNLAFEIL